MVELRAALTDRSVSPEGLFQCIENLQQALLALGKSVYSQSEEDGYSPMTDHAAPWTNGQSDLETAAIEDDDYTAEFDEDETISADYEAVD